MIAARDASGRMLSVFHNRRWDWDFLTVQTLLNQGTLGRPLLVESGVCRHSPPRTWRGRLAEAGTILHDWGAHLVDQALLLKLGRCLRLSAWMIPAPWPGVDSGGHGRISLEFEAGTIVEIETSRVCRLERPRWSILGTEAAARKYGVDPQEDALRRDDLSSGVEPPEHRWRITRQDGADVHCQELESVRGSWDSYYANIADHRGTERALGGHGRTSARGRPRPRRRRAFHRRPSRDRRTLGSCRRMRLYRLAVISLVLIAPRARAADIPTPESHLGFRPAQTRIWPPGLRWSNTFARSMTPATASASRSSAKPPRAAPTSRRSCHRPIPSDGSATSRRCNTRSPIPG